jgi:predicted Zn-dependent protease
MGCPEDALAPLYAAIALDPWAVRPWANLQSYEPDAERSARAAEHVLELDPGLTHYRWRYGLALEFLGDARRACEQFGITVAEDPGNARYWTSYAHSLVAVEDPARARDAIAIARSLGAGGGELDELEERARVDAGRDD